MLIGGVAGDTIAGAKIDDLNIVIGKKSPFTYRQGVENLRRPAAAGHDCGAESGDAGPIEGR